MNCSTEMVAAYFDDELDATERAGVERHLRECANCSHTLGQLRELRSDIKAAQLYYAAPAGLQTSLRPSPGQSAGVAAASWRYAALAASVLLAVSLAWNVVEWRRNAGPADIASGVIAGHIRSLLGAHLVDVPSSDQHTVKPWFAGRLDFSPSVKDLNAAGFSLLGGRADYLNGRRVAALIYQRRQHSINLFMWPSDAGSGRLSRDGYNVVHWSSGGMTFWAVSDVSMSELERFRTLYQE